MFLPAHQYPPGAQIGGTEWVPGFGLPVQIAAILTNWDCPSAHSFGAACKVPAAEAAGRGPVRSPTVFDRALDVGTHLRDERQALISSEPRELTLINIVGPTDPDDLRQLSKRVNLPGVTVAKADTP